MNKFVTDIYHHEKHKRFYIPRPTKPPSQLRQFKPFKPFQPRKPPKVGAIDPDWLQQHIARNGPYLYHGTTEGAAHKITQEGLYPFNEIPGKPQGDEGDYEMECPNCGESHAMRPDQIDCPYCQHPIDEDWAVHAPNNANYEDFYTPRYGHSYMGTEDYIRSQGHIKGGVLGIDLRKLDPNKMNPDEDHFQPGSHTYNSQHPVIQNIEENGDIGPNPYDYVVGDGENLREWADRANLGSSPGETEYSMGRGSMAYNGHIPPEAIHTVGTGQYDPTRYNTPVGNEWLEQGNWVPGQNPETGEPLQAVASVQKTAEIPCPACGGTGDTRDENGCDECQGFGYIDSSNPENTEHGLYHSAPTEDRARILQHGLQMSNPAQNPDWMGAASDQPPGVYMAEDPSDTARGARDVWKIDPQYVDEAERDTKWSDGDAWRVPYSVPAEALTLHRPYDPAIWLHKDDTAQRTPPQLNVQQKAAAWDKSGSELTPAESRYVQSGVEQIGPYIQSLVDQDPATSASQKALQAAGGHVFVVGGAVRDTILGKAPKDLDLMVTGLTPDQVHATLAQLGPVKLTGEDFGVYRYAEGDSEVEVALPRREKSTGGGYKDFDVQADHTMTPEEDLGRRDYTANAMAVDMNDGRLIDPYGGTQDLENGVLRAVRPEALAEDPLRVVRGLTAAAKHGLTPDPVTQEAMKANAPSLAHLPQERIQGELDKIMAAPDTYKAIQLAHDTGVLPHILPEVSHAMGYDQQNPHHEQELGKHLMSVMARAKEISPNDPDLALAGLLHDIGKPKSRWTECQDCKSYVNGPAQECPSCGSTNVSGHYYKKEDDVGLNHEDAGADMAQERMKALKYPNDRTDRVTHLIKHHMYAPFTTEKGGRKFVNRVGDEHADDLMKLRWADQGGKSEYPGNEGFSLDGEKQILNQVRTQQQPTALSQLAINGSDLIQAGIKPGPQMGQILNSLLQAIIEEPSLNTREQLLPMALNMGNPQQNPQPSEPPNTDDGFGYSPMGEEPIDQQLNPRIATTLPKSKIPIGQMTPEQVAEYKAAQAAPQLTPAPNPQPMQLAANILDPVSPTLDPSVFIHPEAPMPQIKPGINKWLHDTIYGALERHGYEGPQRWLHLVLTGSLTTYQFNDASDCDVSLFVDSKVFPEWSRAEMIGIMVKEFDGVIVPGTNHDIQAFVVSAKLQPKDLYRPGLRSALDLDTQKWIVPPDKAMAHEPAKVAHTYALECADKMDRLLTFEPDKAVRYFQILHKRRAKDEADGKGDHSESNVAYKMIHQRFLGRLHELGIRTY